MVPGALEFGSETAAFFGLVDYRVSRVGCARHGASATQGDTPMSLIRRVAVLGSGVMGSGIAAHVANAGIPVLMLDMVPPEAGPGEDRSKASFRNRFALG